MSRMGRSSSMSMGTLVLWIHVLVQRCRSRTYEFLQAGGKARTQEVHHGVRPAACWPTSPTLPQLPPYSTPSTAVDRATGAPPDEEAEVREQPELALHPGPVLTTALTRAALSTLPKPKLVCTLGTKIHLDK